MRARRGAGDPGVSVRSEHPRGAPAARRLRARARRYLAALGQAGAELSVVVVGDRAIRELNCRWRRRDGATDVLSFPAAPAPAPDGGPRPLGDVVISLDTAERAAADLGSTVGEELDRYLAHGLLHLLGHDHHRADDSRRMAEAEDALVGEGMLRRRGTGARAPRRARKRA